jgi:phospholipid/cholesterol/gamma-HCH transport system substrate-binding protein
VSRRTEIQVGLTVLAAVAILLWGVTWLKEFSLARKAHVWTVRFPRTGGLGRSDEVQVNGIRKGAVEDMALVGDHVIVKLALATDVQLTTDSQVAIRNVGLMGEKVIAVDLKTTGRAYTARDTIVGEYELGIPEVMGQMGSTLTNVTELIQQLHDMSQALSRSGDLEKTVRNFAATSEQLKAAVAENRAALRTTMVNFDAASRTAKSLTVGREAQLKQAVDDFAQAAGRMNTLAARMDSLRAVLVSVTGKVDRGEGTLGRLVNDQRLYDDLNTSAQALRALVEDIKKNPKKYLHVSIF